MGHSEIGASSAHRWMNCPGSVRLYRQLAERKSSIYADTGTVAHELAEASLLTGEEPSVAVGTVANINGNEIRITEDMAAAVKIYVDKIREDLKNFGGELKVEQSFDLGWLHEGMFGRNDACIIPSEKFGTLRVYDYKNGAKRVNAEWNAQMMYYALGALGKDNLDIVETVILTIVQPNAYGKEPIDEWEVSVPDLIDWGYNVLLPAVKKTQEPDAPCAMGAWCGFCEAAHLCPARVEAVMSKLPVGKNGAVAELPVVAELNPEQLGKLSRFFTSELFKDWVKAIAAEEQALLAKGVMIPGRKLITVESQGNRKWRDELKVIEDFQTLGDEIYETKLKSPTQMEKLLKSMGYSKQEIIAKTQNLITREVKTETVVVDDTEEGIGVDDRQQKAIELFNNK